MRMLGKFEILEEVGRGGFARVYRARDPDLDREVALKVLAPHLTWDPTFAERFRQEAQATAKLRHPNIVVIHEVGQDGEDLYIAMEYLPGQTLAQLLAEQGALDLDRALPILEQVASALDYAHGEGVLHRDIKPSNVMVQEGKGGDLRATLTDFGLVKAMASSESLTSKGTILGSPHYMAPEQADIKRKHEIGPATDLYALGVVAYEMLVGQLPFPGDTTSTLMARLQYDPPDPQSLRQDLPEDVAQVLLKALSREGKDRYPSAGVMVQALREAQAAEKKQARLADLHDQARTAARRKHWEELRRLCGEIEALEPGYRDTAALRARAEEGLARKEARSKPKTPPAEPREEGEPAAATPKPKWRVGVKEPRAREEAPTAPEPEPVPKKKRRRISRRVWVGGTVAVVLVIVGVVAWQLNEEARYRVWATPYYATRAVRLTSTAKADAPAATAEARAAAETRSAAGEATQIVRLTTVAEAEAAATEAPVEVVLDVPFGWKPRIQETFDDNTLDWPEGDVESEGLRGSRYITGGVYRWEVTESSGTAGVAFPQLQDPCDDFYLTVEAKHTGAPGGYGVIFRWVDGSNFYQWFVDDNTGSTLLMARVDGEWIDLEHLHTLALRPGETNRLAVLGTGSHFAFSVNGQFVGELDDTNHTHFAGLVGFSILLKGDAGVFEFDSFELYTP